MSGELAGGIARPGDLHPRRRVSHFLSPILDHGFVSAGVVECLLSDHRLEHQASHEDLAIGRRPRRVARQTALAGLQDLLDQA